MSSYDSLSLAGLDSAMVLQLDRPSSSNLSSLTNRSCCTSLRTPPKVRAPILTLNDSPLSGSTVYNKAYLPFEPLPPVPSVSSFQLSFILDPTAQPSPRPSPNSLFPPPPPPNRSKSSAGLSRQAVEDLPGSIHGSYQAPEIHDQNNPYTPWPQSIRPLILSPPSPFVSLSHLSHYSRPLSRSGAMAPEPFGSTTSVHGIRCRFPGSFKLRKMKQGLRIFSRRLLNLNMVLRKRSCARTSISPANLRPSSFLSIAFTVSSRAAQNRWSRSRSSIIPLPRNSLTSWIEQRNRASIGYTQSSSSHESMDIDEYERRGSWLLGLDEGCGIDECRMHVPNTEHLEVGDGKYFGISLAAGQEAFRRRRTNSNT